MDEPLAATGGQEQLLAGLRQVTRDVAAAPDVETALIVGRDGLLVAGGHESADGLELPAALAAAAFGATDRALASMDVGPVCAALIETSSHLVQITSMGELLLVVIAGRHANLQQIREEMAEAATTVARAQARSPLHRA